MQIKHFAQLQSSINRGTVYNLPFSTEPNSQSVTLALLNLARNCQVQKHSHLNILQQLTSIISCLVKFNTPINHLAAFDRQQFIQTIKYQRRQFQADDYEIFIEMSQGIYPHKKITRQINSSLNFKFDVNLVDGEEIGNKYWKLARKVMKRYYDIAAQKHKDCLEVLLGREELREEKYKKIQWRSLWTQLYLMTYSILINQDQNFQLVERGQDVIAKLKQAIDLTMQSNYGPTEDLKFKKCILKLVGYIVKKFIFEQQGNDLKEFSQIFERIEQRDFAVLNKYLISLYLTKTILERCNLMEECNRFQDKLDNFINQPKIVTNTDDKNILNKQKEAINLRSYLISSDKLPKFILDNGLNFWDYELDVKVKEDLAEKCLLQYQKLPGNLVWNQVFKHLSESAFEKHILKAGKNWLNHAWTEYLISTALQNKSGIIQNKFSSRKQKEMRSLRRPFFEQWQHFLKINYCGFIRSINEVQQILTFNHGLSEQTQKMIVFPGDNQQYFVHLLISYMKYVIQEKLINDKYHIFFSPQLASNLLRVDNNLLDDYWSLWADMLIYKDSTLDALLKIELNAENNLLQRNALANDSLFLRHL